MYVARSKDALLTKFANHDRAWCGFLWQALSNHSRPASCTVHISPFGTTYVAIGKPRAAIWPAGAPPSHATSSSSPHHASTGAPRCTVVPQQRLNPLLLLQGILGALLYIHAGTLASFQPFRLSLGTLALTLGSVAVLALLLARLVPDKRRLIAATAMFGTSLLSFSHWLFGAWIPSFHQILHSKVDGCRALSACQYVPNCLFAVTASLLLTHLHT